MAKPAKDSISVTARIQSDILADIDRHVDAKQKEKRGQTYNRTDAINEMLPLGLKALQNPRALDVGLFIISNADRLKDPQILEDLKRVVEEGTVVDWIYNLPKAELDTIATIAFDAIRAGAGKTPFSFLDPAEKRKLILRD